MLHSSESPEKTMTFNPDQIYKTMLESGEDWADKKAAYMALEDFTKTHLAAAKSRHPGYGVAATEDAARLDPQFKDHLQALSEARHAFFAAEVRWTATKALVDLRRTEAAHERVMLEKGVISGGA